MEPKILLFDIETTPITIQSWRHYQTDALAILQDFYILCFSYKWAHEKTTRVKRLIDYPKYDKDITCDKALTRDLWKLFDEADILVGHNSDRFDIKRSSARFIINGFEPYSPVRKIDTLKIARKNFGFTSNKLDELGKYLKVGRKTSQGGKLQMWFDCMSGNETPQQKRSWKNMTKYAKQDTVLLQDVYNKLKPWSNTVNLGMYVDSEKPVCPKCGHDKLMKRGTSSTNAGLYQRYQCKNKECRGYSRARKKIEDSGNPLT